MKPKFREACLTCPMLHVEPKMAGRLDDIEADLLMRREHATEEGWVGEIEGIDLTLSFLRGKRQDVARIGRKIHMGIPKTLSEGSFSST